MKAVIILPTYNEADNIGEIIDAVEAHLKKIAHDMYILVVDDESPDGTAAVVEEKKSVYPNLFMISGKKRGLGNAYIRGMTFAIDCLDADAVMEMDADFSHKPSDVPRLLDALDAGADFVIGSRYVKGGTLPDDWGLKRIMLSKFGNIFARHVAGMQSVKDCTAGFRAIRTSLLKKINLADLKVQGYAFQMVLLKKAMNQDGIIKEIPVDFINRKQGETKLGRADILEFFKYVFQIRFDSI